MSNKTVSNALGRAQKFEEEGNEQKAYECYKEAFEINQNDTDVLQKLAISAQVLGLNDKAIAYWNAVPLLTSTYAGTVSFEIYGQKNDIRLIDLSDGSIYRLPDAMISDVGNGQINLLNLPITDTPMLLTFGSFAEEA